MNYDEHYYNLLQVRKQLKKALRNLEEEIEELEPIVIKNLEIADSEYLELKTYTEENKNHASFWRNHYNDLYEACRLQRTTRVFSIEYLKKTYPEMYKREKSVKATYIAIKKDKK